MQIIRSMTIPWRRRFQRWREWPLWTKTMVLAGAVGVVTGLFSTLMAWGVDSATHRFFDIALGMTTVGQGIFSWPCLLIGIPALGGLGTGWLCARVAPESAGGGTDVVVRSFHSGEARLRGRNILTKLFASVMTLGSGGSGGMEGPIIQVGATIGSWASQKLQLLPEQRRTLLIAGAAAGVGSIFRAPLGGALFACEMFYSRSELESEAVVPSLMASVCAYAVFGLFRGFEPILTLDGIPKLDLSTFLILTVLAFFAVLSARAYASVLASAASRLKAIPLLWRPAFGGLMAGATGFTVWFLSTQLGLSHDPTMTLGSLGEGYATLRLVASSVGVLPLSLLALVFIGKILSSGLTISSGGSAGAFAPSMVIGGCLGAMVWKMALALGFTQAPPAAFVLAGMSGFFSAAFRSPLSSVVIIIEVAQGYHLLPALMWVSALGYLLGPDPCVIRAQVPSRGDSAAHRGEMSHDILTHLTVGQAMRDVAHVVSFIPEASLDEIKIALNSTRQEFFPTVHEGEYRGGFFWTAALAAKSGATASSLMAVDIASMRATDSLDVALRRLAEAKADELPVLNEEGCFVGLINRRDIWSRAMDVRTEESESR